MDVVKRLLSAAHETPAGEPPQAEDYDFSRPHLLTTGQWKRVEALIADAAAGMSCNLSSLLGAEITVKVGAVSQEYAVAAIEGASDVVVIRADERPVGFASVDAPLARRWVARLLGGAEPSEDRQLSALERTLLADVLGSAVKAVASEISRANGPLLHCDPDVAPADDALRMASHEPLCRLAFGISEGEQDPGDAKGVEVVLLTDVIAAAVSAVSAKPKDAEGVRRDVEHWLGGVPIQLCAGVRTRVTMGHLLSLEPGDVLLTDAGVEAPAELLISGRPRFLGTPVACQGQYALQLVARAR